MRITEYLRRNGIFLIVSFGRVKPHLQPTKNHPMKYIAIITMGLALAMPLQAEEATEAPKKPDPEKIFTKKDKNEDGFLSKEEFTAGAKDATKADAAFSKKDKDSDGKISKEEFLAAPDKGKKAAE
jgi:Ca2+-binding EF-hand superfamily protein